MMYKKNVMMHKKKVMMHKKKVTIYKTKFFMLQMIMMVEKDCDGL